MEKTFLLSHFQIVEKYARFLVFRNRLFFKGLNDAILERLNSSHKSKDVLGELADLALVGPRL